MSFLSSGTKDECTGCRACESICPKGCIEMTEDDEGFVYPSINREECIRCHRCEQTCPHEYKKFIDKGIIKAYVGIHNSESVIKESSSGGAFSAIAENKIKEGWIVYGAKFSEDFIVIHDSATTVDECRAFRRSKYIQSNTNGCFEKVKNDLIEGKKVLFSGVPCQCAALKMYLENSKISYIGRLITLSILCHGVPNQRIFNRYIKELEEAEHKKVKEYSFRYKGLVHGKSNSRSAMIVFSDGTTKTVDLNDDPFLKGYYKRLFYRPSCAKCNFARQDRVADITLADAWKIEQLIPEYDALKGVSLILSATNEGDKIIENNLKEMTIQSIDTGWALNSQAIMKKPTVFHENRNKFFKIYKNSSFKKAVNNSTLIVPFGRVKRIIARRISKLFHY